MRTSHHDAPRPGGSLDILQKDLRGNYVIIDNGHEFSVIAHLAYNSVTVNVGDVLKQGTLIGYCGNSETLQNHISIFIFRIIQSSSWEWVYLSYLSQLRFILLKLILPCSKKKAT